MVATLTSAQDAFLNEMSRRYDEKHKAARIMEEVGLLEAVRAILRRDWGGGCKPHDFLMSCGACRARVAIRCLDETIELHREDLAEP